MRSYPLRRLVTVAVTFVTGACASVPPAPDRAIADVAMTPARSENHARRRVAKDPSTRSPSLFSEDWRAPTVLNLFLLPALYLRYGASRIRNENF